MSKGAATPPPTVRDSDDRATSPWANLSVSPAFPARFAKPCGVCKAQVNLDEQARIISNDLRKVRTVVHDRCVPPQLAAKATQSNPTLADVLGGAATPA